MKQLVLGLALGSWFAGCGDNHRVLEVAIDAPPAIDAAEDAALDAAGAETCDPLAPAGQQGCATGQKCTWIQVESTPVEVGKLGCVPDGHVAPPARARAARWAR